MTIDQVAGVADREGAAVGSRPPPNWYPDPTRRFRARYWNGIGWTTQAANRPDQIVTDSPTLTELLPDPKIGTGASAGEAPEPSSHQAVLKVAAAPLRSEHLMGPPTAVVTSKSNPSVQPVDHLLDTPAVATVPEHWQERLRATPTRSPAAMAPSIAIADQASAPSTTSIAAPAVETETKKDAALATADKPSRLRERLRPTRTRAIAVAGVLLVIGLLGWGLTQRQSANSWAERSASWEAQAQDRTQERDQARHDLTRSEGEVDDLETQVEGLAADNAALGDERELLRQVASLAPTVNAEMADCVLAYSNLLDLALDVMAFYVDISVFQAAANDAGRICNQAVADAGALNDAVAALGI